MQRESCLKKSTFTYLVLKHKLTIIPANKIKLFVFFETIVYVACLAYLN